MTAAGTNATRLPAPTLSAAAPETGTNAAAARQAAMEQGRTFARQRFEQDAERLDRNIVGPALVYQYTNYGNGAGNQNWFSAGVRPVYEFNKYLSLAFEGADYVSESLTGTSGNLFKLTLAPQVALGNQFFSRPVLCAYVTYAHWSNDFVGQVGGQDYLTDHNGLSYAAQMETWW